MDPVASSKLQRRASLDQETVRKLERRLSLRPDKTELVDRNILRDDNVAPALQATRDRLQRSQLEVKLSHALQQRPNVDELVSGGILTSDQVTIP